MKENSIYSFVASVVKNRKYNEEAIIDGGDLLLEIQRNIDLSEMPREELEKRFLKAVMWSTLNHEGYYSLVRREGLYVNFETMNNSKILKQVKDKLIENRTGDIRYDESVINELEKLFREKADGMAQLNFDFENGDYYQDLTRDELIQAIKDMYEEQRRIQ